MADLIGFNRGIKKLCVDGILAAKTVKATNPVPPKPVSGRYRILRRS